MNLQLLRLSSENCYLHSVVNLDNEFVCDTLEFNNELTLPVGSYSLQVFRVLPSNEKTVYLLDSGFKQVSKFVKCNTQFVGSLELRLKNSLIETGIMSSKFKLTCFDQVNKLLVAKIEKAVAKNETCSISILNAIPDSFVCDYVTSY